MLELRGVRFAHHGRDPVVDGLDLTVPDGEIHLLEGPSGSGKSTLLRIATGLIPRVQGGHLAGQALLEGEPVDEIPAARLPNRLGWVPQDPEESFAARTVKRELTQLARNLEHEAPVQAARDALDDLDAAHLLDRGVDELSGGEAARVSLAAAGLGDPDALVLDEPTADLDRAGRKQVAAWLDEHRRRGASVLVAEHAPHPLGDLVDARHSLGANDTQRPSAGPPVHEPGERLLAVDGLVRDYQDGTTVGPVDLDLHAGEVVAITGPNGSGKTTALHAAIGLEAADEGRVRLLGDEPGALSATELARRAAVAFQHPAWHITQDTVHEEVAFTPDRLEIPVDPQARLEALGLSALAGEHPWDLSGGERQRMAVATASAHEPPVLLLDEPTRGLDPASLSRLAELLSVRAEQGKATLVATHHPWLVELAHRIIRLEGAR